MTGTVEGTVIGVIKDVKTTHHYTTCIFTKVQCGDIDLDRMDEISSAYTPVPGGVGPMTINTLILHTMQSAKKLLTN